MDITTVTQDELRSPQILVRLVEHLGEPATTSSEGSKFLLRVAECWEETHADYHNNDTMKRDIASTCIPPWTHQKWQIFVDLCAYRYRAENEAMQFLTEKSDMTEMAEQTLLWITCDLVDALNEWCRNI
jgi:hypothetical protein